MHTTTTTDPSIARAIEAARKQARLTKFKTAVRAGLSLTTVRLAEQGVATPRTLAALARVFGVTFDQLACNAVPQAEAAR